MSKQFRLFTFVIFGLLILLALTIRILENSKYNALPILGQVPEFTLTNSQGEKTTLENFQGKVWAADFIFTTCAGPCPIMSTQMSVVHKNTQKEDGIRLVSISVNPDYDTPEVLTEYAARYNADTEKWQFLTGPIAEIQHLIVDGFKIGDPEEIVFHSTKFALVDQKGQIRGYYTGTDEEDVKKMNKDMIKLLEEI